MTELNNLRGIQVVANQTVVQAQAQAKANIAKASGESQAIKIITSQLRQILNIFSGKQSIGGMDSSIFFRWTRSSPIFPTTTIPV